KAPAVGASASTSTTASGKKRSRQLTRHLRRAGLTERRFEVRPIGGATVNEHAEAVAAEPRIVSWQWGEPRESSVDEEADETRERPEEDRKLEGDDHEGRDRDDGHAARAMRVREREVDGQPETAEAAGEPVEEDPEADRAPG